jgi:hypothetical protein
MACDHCHGRFVARDPSSVSRGVSESDLLRRAEELLQSLDSQHMRDQHTHSTS